MTQEELNKILELHRKWYYGEPDGQKANLRGANLAYLDLSGAQLCEADLSEAFLYCVNLSRANLSGVNLSRANLSKCDLSNSILFRAYLGNATLVDIDFCRTDLTKADFSFSNLLHVDFYGATLFDTVLNNAILFNINLAGVNLDSVCLDSSQEFRKGVILTENLIGYKKCEDDVIVTLEIPKGAIVFCINGNKCRTNIAKCIGISNNQEIAYSNYDETFTYEIGKTYVINDFNLMYNIECGTGIHFFKTRKEAEDYELL